MSVPHVASILVCLLFVGSEISLTDTYRECGGGVMVDRVILADKLAECARNPIVAVVGMVTGSMTVSMLSFALITTLGLF